MEKILNVKYGTIYTRSGMGIDNLAVILDKNSGLIKYGDSSRGMKEIFNDMVSKYKQLGLEDMANDLVLLEFDRYDGILSIDEICTFANYMIMVSANSQNIFKMLSMEEIELKKRLKEFSALGF